MNTLRRRGLDFFDWNWQHANNQWLDFFIVFPLKKTFNGDLWFGRTNLLKNIFEFFLELTEFLCKNAHIIMHVKQEYICA